MKPFSTEQLRIVKRHWNGENLNEMANLLDMPQIIVQGKLGALPKAFLEISLEFQEELRQADNQPDTDNSVQCKWDDWEIEYLKKNFSELGPQMVAVKLERGVEGVKQKAYQLGLSVRSNNGPEKTIKQRPPAVYSNRNFRQELLDKYAPIN